MPQLLHRPRGNKLDDLIELLAQKLQRLVGEFCLLGEERLVDQHGPALNLPDLVAIAGSKVGLALALLFFAPARGAWLSLCCPAASNRDASKAARTLPRKRPILNP